MSFFIRHPQKNFAANAPNPFGPLESIRRERGALFREAGRDHPTLSHPDPRAADRARWLALVCLGLGSPPLLAAVDDWNCQRSQDGKEWVCSTQKAKPAEEAGPASRPSPPRTARPERPAEPAVPPAEPEKPAALPPMAQPEPPAAEEPARPETPESPEPSVATESEAEKRPPPQLKRLPGTLEMQPPPSRQAAAAPPPERPGWTCRAGEAETGQGWDCSLVGPDPEGRSHAVAENGSAAATVNWAQSTTITPEDEQRFQRITSLLPADPWINACAGKRESQPLADFLLTSEEKLARERAPLDIHSNYAEMLDGEIATFTGGAELVREDQKLWADFVSHNTVADTLNARGNVVYQEQGLAFAADSAFLDMETDRRVFRNSQFILETVPARGTSRLTYFDNANLSRYQTFTYTACPPGDRDWMLHARDVKINKETGRGSASHAWLEFKGVPMFYTPYMSFPVDDRRQTGFLNPSFGTTKVGGVDLTVPYYFNLAPNYDTTFTPRLLTRRGILLRDEFRYLSGMTRGRILAEYMPHDEIRGQSRGQAGFLNDTRFTDRLTSHIDANYVSDNRYLNDLGNSLNIVDYRYVRSNGYLNYVGSNYSMRTNVDYFQTIDPTILEIDRPYYRLPQFLFNYGQGIGNTGLVFDGALDLANFAHDSGDKVIGQRLNAKPRLYYPFQTAAGFVTPSLTLQHTEYWLQNQAPGQSSDISRTTPIASVDSGLYFERELEFGKKPWVQTLEPRLFYLYVPYTDQKDIPIFDTSEYDFTFYQLFRENRFTNADRLSDANQVTTALTSRFIDESTGLERLRTSVGKIFYFDTPQVSLTSFTPPTQVKENIIADVYSRLTNTWSFRTAGQWNPSEGRIDRGQVSLQYDNRRNDLFNIAYRFRRDQNLNAVSLDLTDVSFRIPIVKDWHVIGRWQYSLLDQVTLESFFGFERETCCWRFTLLGRHYINGPANTRTGNNTANNGVFLQLELKGLTRLGDQVDQFLRRSISGYRFEDD
jgi:LPS-assembly protein